MYINALLQRRLNTIFGKISSPFSDSIFYEFYLKRTTPFNNLDKFYQPTPANRSSLQLILIKLQQKQNEHNKYVMTIHPVSKMYMLL